MTATKPPASKPAEGAGAVAPNTTKAPAPAKAPAPKVLGSSGPAKKKQAGQSEAKPTTRVTLSKGKGKAGGGLLAQIKASKGAVIDKIEEKVLAIPEFKDIQAPQIFRDFVEKVTPKISLRKTSYGILSAFSNIDVTAEKVGNCLKSNAYYSQQFFKTIESMGKREQVPSTEGAVVLLGMQNSRNLILAFQALRSVTNSHPEWSKEGKLKVAPSDIVKYALKTEEILMGNKSGYADTAYAAGFMFDVLSLLANAVVEDKKKINAYIDTVYTHGLVAAKIGMELSKNVPEFSFTKFAFSACLVHDIGKIIMAILDINYISFQEEMVKKGLPRGLRNYAEGKQFGITHAWLSSLACHYFKIFRPIEKAIFYHHDPYFLKSNKNLYQTSALIALATNMANNLKKVDKSDDPIVAEWKSLELKDFRIDFRAIANAAARAL